MVKVQRDLRCFGNDSWMRKRKEEKNGGSISKSSNLPRIKERLITFHVNARL
jgi:hypothetical protein